MFARKAGVYLAGASLPSTVGSWLYKHILNNSEKRARDKHSSLSSRSLSGKAKKVIRLTPGVPAM
jgi:hypothetical protein